MTANAMAGGLQLAWLKQQATFNTPEAFVATDAISPEKGGFKIDPVTNFEPKKECSGTFTNQGAFRTDYGGKWSSGQMLIKPIALGTAPDIGQMIEAAMGLETATPATSVVYTLSDTLAVIGMQAAINIAAQLQHVMSGAYVEEMTIEIPQRGLPTFQFSGQFAGFGWAYADVIGATALATGETHVHLANASRGCLGPGAVVQFVDDTGTAGAGYTITAVDNTAGSATATFSPGLVGAGESAGGAIIPLVPAQTVGGTAITGVSAALTVGGVSLGFISAKFTLKTGIVPRVESGYGGGYISGIFRGGERSIEGELKFYLLDSNAGWTPMVGGAHEPILRAIALRVGADTAGSHMHVNVPNARLDVAQIDLPGSEMVTGTMKLIGQQSAAAADEFALTFD